MTKRERELVAGALATLEARGVVMTGSAAPALLRKALAESVKA